MRPANTLNQSGSEVVADSASPVTQPGGFRSKKRARRPLRDELRTLKEHSSAKYTIVQRSDRSSLSANALAKRHAHSLANLCKQPWPHPIPRGRLILVMDAIWFKKDEDRHTVYLTGLRRVEDDTLHFLRPILRPGPDRRSGGEK